MARILTPPSQQPQRPPSTMVRSLILPTTRSPKLNLSPVDARSHKTEQALVPSDWPRLVHPPHPIIILGRDKGPLQRFLQNPRRTLARPIPRRKPLDVRHLLHV